jgi:hypothetical protein
VCAYLPYNLAPSPALISSNVTVKPIELSTKVFDDKANSVPLKRLTVPTPALDLYNKSYKILGKSFLPFQKEKIFTKLTL